MEIERNLGASENNVELRLKQSYLMGIVGGILGAIIGALIWALVTAITKYQIGYLSILVGFLVGFGVRKLGKGVDMPFGIIGAILALLGCAVGNLLAICIFISKNEAIPLMHIITQLDFEKIKFLMTATFNIKDILFYGLAVYAGFKFSFSKEASSQREAAKI